jgi:hypothetical protein
MFWWRAIFLLVEQLSSLRSGRSPTPNNRSDIFQSEARSAEASATARRTKCAPAERSRQAACVSEIISSGRTAYPRFARAVLRPRTAVVINSLRSAIALRQGRPAVARSAPPRSAAKGCLRERNKPTSARSAEARPTGRRTKCAPAERSRQAACVSGIN